MGHFYDEIPDDAKLIEWVKEQQLFHVATAPLKGKSHFHPCQDSRPSYPRTSSTPVFAIVLYPCGFAPQADTSMCLLKGRRRSKSSTGAHAGISTSQAPVRNLT